MSVRSQLVGSLAVEPSVVDFFVLTSSAETGSAFIVDDNKVIHKADVRSL